jgi:linoleate 9S-lipoxygenase
MNDESDFNVLFQLIDRVRESIMFLSIRFFVNISTDPNTESKLNPLEILNVYVPRDERFDHLKMSDVVAYALKIIAQFLKPELEAQFNRTPNDFDSLEDVLKLYDGGIELPKGLLENIRESIPLETLKEIFRTDGQRLLKFPVPQVIKGNGYICNLYSK